jgi:hypothetical protein
MQMHKSLNTARLMNAVRRSMSSLDNPGFCVACGKDADGCEPDAREYECEHCGEFAVFGAEELLLEVTP